MKENGEKHHFSVLSEKTCVHPSCTKRLKQNLVDKNPDAEMCYWHHIWETQPHLANKKLHLKLKPQEDSNETIPNQN